MLLRFDSKGSLEDGGEQPCWSHQNKTCLKEAWT